MSEMTKRTDRRWRKRLLLIACGLIAIAIFFGATAPEAKLREQGDSVDTAFSASTILTAKQIDDAINASIEMQKLTFADEADWSMICRRISLALTGCSLSLQEYRAIETLGGKVSDPSLLTNDQRITWWTNYLLADTRWSDYFAERFSRAFVGTNQGPFIVFRRRRFEQWLAEEFKAGKPYDQIVRQMIAAEGLWTGNPEVNF